MDKGQVAQMLISSLTLIGCGAGYLALKKRDKSPGAPVQAPNYGSHGSSRWAIAEEILSSFATEGAGAVLGKVKRRGRTRQAESWQRVIFPWDRSAGNRFILAVGPPGSGKTFCYTLPNLLHAATCDGKRSLVITDPKGDLYRDTGKLLADKGYSVKVVNLKPDEMHASCRYNPMDYVKTPEDAQRLAATIVSNTEGPHSGGEAFWRHSEEALIACLIWYVMQACPEGERHLGNVLHLASAFAADKALMERAFQGFDPTDPVRRLYGPIAGLEDKTRSGVFVGVTASRLKIWASDRITALTAKSDFMLRDLGTDRTALYLIIPDSDSTYRVLSSLFFDQCFQELITLADASKGRLPVECRILLEEMANIGRIPDLDKRLATIRSRGIIVEMIVQTLGQLKALYGDVWSTIVGCADTLLVLAANDLETAQYVSQTLGMTTIRTSSQSLTQAQRGSSEAQSQHYTGRALMTPEEVMGQGVSGLKPDELLLIRRGMQARLTKNPVADDSQYSRIEKLEPAKFPAPPRDPFGLTDVAKLGPKQEEVTPPTPAPVASPTGTNPSWATKA